jgi:hypothetical protein
MEEQVGTASYQGTDEYILRSFGRLDTPLFNSEGFYVRDDEGNQILTDKDWKLNVKKP